MEASVEYLYFHNTNSSVIDEDEAEYFKVQKDKFEAAVMAPDGDMYCMPLRASYSENCPRTHMRREMNAQVS